MIFDDAPTPILCVDDEPAILDGLARQLRHHYDVVTATSGANALQLLEADPDRFAVVVSDMMMPQMTGAEFLARARSIAPGAVRILLTGHADIESAVAAVNDGGISHFLTKPCPRSDLLAALSTAVAQHRAAAIEHQVLDETLRGAVDALAETLSIAAPVAFARMSRIRRTVADLSHHVDARQAWVVGVAVPLSLLGSVALPNDLLARLNDGLFLSPEENELVAAVPAASLRIIGRVPRLDAVCALIREAFDDSVTLGDESLPARLLRIAFEIDAVESRGMDRKQAVRVLASRLHSRDQALLDSLLADPGIVHDLPFAELRHGMRFAADLVDRSGVLLVGRGSPITDTILDRLRNLEVAGRLPATIRVRSNETPNDGGVAPGGPGHPAHLVSAKT